MSGPSPHPRFSVVCLKETGSRGQLLHEMVISDAARPGLTIQVVVNVDATTSSTRLKKIAATSVSGSTGDTDLRACLSEAGWLQGLLRAAERHTNSRGARASRPAPKRDSTRHPLDHLHHEQRRLLGLLARSFEPPDRPDAPPLPEITEAVVDQLMEEITEHLSRTDNPPDQA